MKPLVIGKHTIEKPIIQGGMGIGISMAGLAGAVSLAGGLGTISAAQIGFMEPDYEKNPVVANLRALKKQIAKAKEIACGKMVAVNIMYATRYYDKYVEAALEAGVDLIVSGAGVPVELPELVQGKTCIAPIVSSARSAMVLLKMWDRKYKTIPDIVIIEGPLAGGHLGFSKEQLDNIDALNYSGEIIQIVKIVSEYETKYQRKIPIVMGGGIHDREDVKNVIELGLDGVQVASRFVATNECDADIRFKEAYVNAKKEDIVIVKSPVGMPGRAIKNKFMSEDHSNTVITKCYQCIKGCTCRDIPYCITKALINGAKGNIDEALVFCGAKTYKIDKILSVNDVIFELEV